MGNGIPSTLPADESRWDESQKMMDKLGIRMADQAKKERDPRALQIALDGVKEHVGMNQSTSAVVKRAEMLHAMW
jgi:hypothetical protein